MSTPALWEEEPHPEEESPRGDDVTAGDSDCSWCGTPLDNPAQQFCDSDCSRAWGRHQRLRRDAED